MRSFVVLALLVACGGSSKSAAPESPPPTASMVDCPLVADQVTKVVAADKPRPGATIEAVQNMLRNRCRADAWSDETKLCLFASKTIAEARACASTMTEQQRTAIEAQARALRTDAPEPATGAQADWVEHVVEEQGTPTR